MPEKELKIKTTTLTLTPEQLKLIEQSFGKEFADKVSKITVGKLSDRLEIMGNAN